MLNYEITFLVDPVLSSEEIDATAQTYTDMLTKEGCTIVHVNALGLKQLAYPINKRTSGMYFCVEFQSQNGTIIPRAELALTRDERIMRFLTVSLDRYGVKYNQDKRDGKIGTKKREAKKEEPAGRNRSSSKAAPAKSAPTKPTPEKAAPAKPALAKSAPEKAAPAKPALAKSAPEKAAPAKPAPEKATSEKPASEKATPEKAVLASTPATQTAVATPDVQEEE